ncbi:MAG: glycosyltransferase family 9 protein [Nocardioidaceae bacterium]
MTEETRERWQAARRVLCVRLDTIGDVLMTGPAIRGLKEQRADRRVSLLTSRAGAAAGRLLPGVDEVIVYDPPWMKATAPRADPGPDLRLAGALRERGFDAAAIFTVYSQSPLPAALLLHLAGVPRRLAHCRENPYALLTDWLPEREPHELVRHEVRRQLDLVAAVGAAPADELLAVELPEAARAAAASALVEAGVDRSRLWLVVHPGASAPSRRYPLEAWAHACRALAGEHGVQLVLTGDSGDVALVESLRARVGAPAASLAGRLDLAGLAALLEAAPLLLAGNTGPVHVAAAVGTPVVDLYALTNPQHAPWGVPARVLFEDVPCRWCYKSVCPEGHHDCLRRVAPERVADAALELLRDGRAAGRPAGLPYPAPG